MSTNTDGVSAMSAELEALPCPFCGAAPRYLGHKAGFYSERLICDHCNFYLPPETWAMRRAVYSELSAARLRASELLEIVQRVAKYPANVDCAGTLLRADVMRAAGPPETWKTSNTADDRPQVRSMNELGEGPGKHDEHWTNQGST